jgi:hypothetical protein
MRVARLDLAAQENKQQAEIQKPVSVRFHPSCHFVLLVCFNRGIINSIPFSCINDWGEMSPQEPNLPWE